MHDHTSKGLKQLAVMKISSMILRYCITYHHYNTYFSHIFLLYHKNSRPPTPYLVRSSCATPLHPPSGRGVKSTQNIGTNVANVGSVFNDTRKVKALSLPETIKEKSTFRAKALHRELVVGCRGKRRVFLYELIQKHHVTK